MRFIQHPETLELIPADEYERPTQSGITVIGDIQPYQSVVTGEVVGGRRQHREYLKRNSLVEIGNEYKPPKAIPKVGGVREDIRSSYRQLSRKS